LTLLSDSQLTIEVSKVLKGAIRSRLPKWINILDVTDHDGNAPNASNNYLMAEDGKSFTGVYSLNTYRNSYGGRRYRQSNYAQADTVVRGTFKFYEKSKGKWAHQIQSPASIPL